jgi:energy-coupling factor transport system substrate-specific component
MKLSSSATKLSVRELCILSLLGALMLALQVAASGLPNIHLTAPIIIIAAVFFGWKSLYAIAVFIMLEGLVWGFGLWWACYWYLWPSLAIPAIIMRRNRSAFIWVFVAAIHGLLFGLLYALAYYFVGGFEMVLAKWVSGIPFDLAHCAGNFVLTLLLFEPLYKAFSKALKQ